MRIIASISLPAGWSGFVLFGWGGSPVDSSPDCSEVESSGVSMTSPPSAVLSQLRVHGSFW
ncbi:hypothetical protein [Chroococcidiopsis sp. SAG 2025]|uniref:hypothetical protein n=1 Tax=Chroococcidiopsis sp. SAG 2025 TaxID=171389 RepID=UPI00293746C6|nr:hypothetical protein [Chroococcidiopsis sp. SAG 2025]